MKTVINILIVMGIAAVLIFGAAYLIVSLEDYPILLWIIGVPFAVFLANLICKDIDRHRKEVVKEALQEYEEEKLRS